MGAIKEEDLKTFVDSIRHYFVTVTNKEPQITAAFLDTGDVKSFEFNGRVSFSHAYTGSVLVSMQSLLLRELLLLQGEKDLSENNLLDTVGEIANTLAGNARKHFGTSLEISVPQVSRGIETVVGVMQQRPYIITLRWGKYPALICVDLR